MKTCAFFGKAFSHEGPGHYRGAVDQNGTVRVYCHVAGYYTTCHSLSETDQDKLRARAQREAADANS